MSFTTRAITSADLHWVHDLNQQHGTELSLQSFDQFQDLVAKGTRCLCVDDKAAFLLSFDQDAGIEGPNYRWFGQRYDSFLYVDRIAVAESHRRKGIAQLIYRDLIAYARDAGYARITCEVNSDPPNPASDAFHASFGFVEVGSAELADRGKTVRYYSLNLNDAA